MSKNMQGEFLGLCFLDYLSDILPKDNPRCKEWQEVLMDEIQQNCIKLQLLFSTTEFQDKFDQFMDGL